MGGWHQELGGGEGEERGGEGRGGEGRGGEGRGGEKE